jgi:hypothetical protein
MRKYIYSSLMSFVLAMPAVAAEAPKTEPLPYIPPPPSIIDPDLEPQVTIKKEGGDRMEEFRIKGRLYMIKVTPPHGRPYYLIDPRGDGQLRRYDDLSPNFLVPLWVVKEF